MATTRVWRTASTFFPSLVSTGCPCSYCGHSVSISEEPGCLVTGQQKVQKQRSSSLHSLVQSWFLSLVFAVLFKIGSQTALFSVSFNATNKRSFSRSEGTWSLETFSWHRCHCFSNSSLQHGQSKAPGALRAWVAHSHTASVPQRAPWPLGAYRVFQSPVLQQSSLQWSESSGNVDMTAVRRL